MKCRFISDFWRKDTHYFDILFVKRQNYLLISIKFPYFRSFRKYNLQICSILPNEPKEYNWGQTPFARGIFCDYRLLKHVQKGSVPNCTLLLRR